tara:strand:- start:44 stop:1132 length:1089 start_codon:yes stop_codon:yes gene_type:complete
MVNSTNTSPIDKIEAKFDKDFNYSFADYKKKNKTKRSMPQLKHLFWMPSLFYKRIYWILPRILKDIFFFLSILHKSPNTKIFARTKYEELRILLDVKVSALVLKIAPKELESDVSKSFKSGYCSFNLPNIDKLNPLIDEVITYSNPSHAGAQPYFKDGKEETIKNSFSAYYSFTKEDNKKINSFLNNNVSNDFKYHLSALAGYKCEIKDFTYSLSIVQGENSNSEMHQDTYGSVAKGFIYLQNIDKSNSPFEYLKGSYIDASYRSHQTNKAVLNNDLFSSGSTRLRNEDLDDAINKFGIETFTGSKGLFVLANTSGYHRKGAHNSDKPRIILACGVERKGVLSKLVHNLYSILKLKAIKISK